MALGFGLTLILLTLIIGSFSLFGVYMYNCYEKDIKMFANPKYDKRIKDLEEKITRLEKKE